MGYSLGVDLGTTYTAAAICRDGRAEIASLGDRSVAIPSVLFVRPDGDVVTGDAAVRRLTTEPDRVAREFKRRLGDQTPIFLGGSPYSADALMGRLLKWTIDSVSRRENAPPDHVVISHPANWGPYKRELIQQAIEQAGIERADTITEPQAAAIHYASLERVDAGTTIVVYDLGGGTFDAAVLRKTDDGFKVLGEPVGIERLGGIDFDAAVFEHVRRSLGDAMSELDPDDERAVAAIARLRQDCIDAKEALTTDTDVSVPVMLPSVQTEVRLTRGEFEDMIRPQIADSVEALKRAIASAGLTPDDIGKVLLAGGSSRIPLVSDLISHELGRPIAVDTHPKHAVALGAALLAAQTDAPATPTSDTPPSTTGTPPEPVATGVTPQRESSGGGVPWKVVGGIAGVIAIVAIAAFVVLSGGGGDGDAVPGDDTGLASGEAPDGTDTDQPVADEPAPDEPASDGTTDTSATDDTAAPEGATDDVVTDGPALIVELPTPDTSPIEPIEVTEPVNLAPYARVIANAELDGPVELLTDGVKDDDNYPWVAGDIPAWVEFDLRTPSTITELRVTPFQGGSQVELASRHELSVRASETDDWQVVQTLAPRWVHRQEHIIALETPLEGIRFVRIDSLQTPDAPGWFEIEIYGIPSDTTVLAPPQWVNVAPYTTVSASSATESGRPGLAVDGVTDASSAWIAEPGVDTFLQFDLPEPITLADVTLFSGNDDHGRIRYLIEISQNGGEFVTVSDRTFWMRNEQELVLRPPTPYPQVTAVRITTLPTGYADGLSLALTWWEVYLWAS